MSWGIAIGRGLSLVPWLIKTLKDGQLSKAEVKARIADNRRATEDRLNELEDRIRGNT